MWIVKLWLCCLSVYYNQYFHLLCRWQGNSTRECKSKIGPIINNCRRFNVNNTAPLLEMYEGAVVERSNVTINDPSHPVHSGYNKSPAGTRWTAVQGRPARYRGTCPSNQYWTLFNWCKWSWYTGRPPIHLLPTALLFYIYMIDSVNHFVNFYMLSFKFDKRKTNSLWEQ